MTEVYLILFYKFMNVQIKLIIIQLIPNVYFFMPVFSPALKTNIAVQEQFPLKPAFALIRQISHVLAR